MPGSSRISPLRRMAAFLRPRSSAVFRTPIGRLRVIGIVEGVSFLVLLLIAMPLKYAAGKPEAVQVVGMAHGVLFLLYVGAAWFVAKLRNWPNTRLGFAFVASVLPAGTFVFD